MDETGNSPGRRRWMFGLVTVVLVGAAFVMGRHSRPAVARETVTGARQVLYYVDPMHPAYRSNKPGKAPDCGMDLEPVYAATTPGDIHLAADQEQAIRLETEVVSLTSTPHRLETVGRVTPDEARTYRVSAGVDGWIRKVFSDRTGTRVKRGEALAAFFSKDLSAPQQAYVYALESYDTLKKGAHPSADSLSLATQELAIARDNLESLGMGEAQIEQVGRTRREFYDVDLTTPADGQILERHVSVGQRFNKGELLYRLANLDRVWILADVYSGEAASWGAITKAQINIDGLPPIEARVEAVPTQFDEQGRTGTLRLEVNNPHGTLVPGMIVNVALDGAARSAVTVSADAVIDTGTQKRVFVALGDGQYQLRPVETGWQDGDRIEIRTGLKAGDRVVTAGAFLLDSESRIKNPADHGSLTAQRTQ
jgi:membrane fusion protein, copper/silver efflux system